MKNNILLALLLWSFFSMAQNNSTQWIDKISFGGTNVFGDLACDEAGNTYSLGMIKETTSQWDMGMALIKYGFDGSVLWQESFEGQYSSSSNLFIKTYNDHIYIVALIQGQLQINANTTITTQNQDLDFLLMKLTSDGTPVWWKLLGIPGDDEMFEIWFRNGSLMVMLERGNYNFDGTAIGSVPSNKFGVARINEDGTFHSLSASSGTYFNPVFADVINNNETEIWWRALGQPPTSEKLLIKGMSDVNGNFTGTDTISYDTRSLQTNFNFGECRKLPNNNGYMLAVNSYDYDWGGDSILRTNSNFGHQVLKLNNDLTLDTFIQLSTYRDFALGADQIAIQGTAQPSLHIGADSIYTDYISDGGHPLSTCLTYITDFDFTPIRYFQVSSEDGVFDHEGMDFDTSGYVVSQYTEAKDIFWGDTIMESALKNIKHLSVIGKEGDKDVANFLAEKDFENALKIYPNPSQGLLRVADVNEVDYLEAELFDLQGKSVSFQRTGNATLHFEDIAAGTYLLRLSDDGETSVVEKVVFY